MRGVACIRKRIPCELVCRQLAKCQNLHVRCVHVKSFNQYAACCCCLSGMKHEFAVSN